MDFGCKKAIIEASAIIEKLRIYKASEILINEVAWTHGLVIRHEFLKGACARLLRVGDVGVIRVSDKIKEIGALRFAIAHELGHFVLHKTSSHLDVYSDTHNDMAIWQQDGGRETEANYFASELLMPKALFECRCDLAKVSFKEILPLADEFQTSLTATALRLVQFCPESCIVIVSVNGRIKWHRKSQNCYLKIANGALLDKRSLAYEYFVGRNIPKDAEEVASDVWANNGYSSKEIWEHSVAMPSYNAVLTLLWQSAD